MSSFKQPENYSGRKENSRSETSMSVSLGQRIHSVTVLDLNKLNDHEKVELLSPVITPQ